MDIQYLISDTWEKSQGSNSLSLQRVLELEDIKEIERIISSNPSLLEEKIGKSSPLHFAIKKGKPESALKLIELGANLDEETSNTSTLLWSACYYHQPNVVEKLLTLRPDFVNTPRKEDRTAPLHAVFSKESEERLAIVSLLLSHGANPNLKDQHERTVLDYLLSNLSDYSDGEEFAKLIVSAQGTCSRKTFNRFIDLVNRKGRYDSIVELGLQTGNLLAEDARQNFGKRFLDQLHLIQTKSIRIIVPFSVKLLHLFFQAGIFSTPDQPLKTIFQLGKGEFLNEESFPHFVKSLDFTIKDKQGHTWLEVVTKNYSPQLECLFFVDLALRQGAEVPKELSEEWHSAIQGIGGSPLDRWRSYLKAYDQNGYQEHHKFNIILKDLPVLNLKEKEELIEGEWGKLYVDLLLYSDKSHKNIFYLLNNLPVGARARLFDFLPSHLKPKIAHQLIEQGLDPFTILSQTDQRCLLRILLDGECERDFIQITPVLNSYLSTPEEKLVQLFEEKSLLQYKMNNQLKASLRSIFKFALQAVSIPKGTFCYDIAFALGEKKSSQESENFKSRKRIVIGGLITKKVKSSGSSSSLFSPLISLYAEDYFLNNASETLPADWKKGIEILLYHSSPSQASDSHHFFEKYGITVVPSGFVNHAFPVGFFNARGMLHRWIPNRGGGGFKHSYTAHLIQPISRKVIQEVIQANQLNKKESLRYFFYQSARDLQATGTKEISQLVLKVLSKKIQTAPNCQMVSGKTAVEILLAGLMLQTQEKSEEEILKLSNFHYKWISVYAAIGALNHLYESAKQNGCIFDPDIEVTLREKVEKKVQKNGNRLGGVPPFIASRLKRLQQQSDEFRAAIPAELMKKWRAQTVPLEAVKRGDLEAVKQHLKSNIHLKNAFGRNSLQEAILNGQKEIAFYLIEQGIDLLNKDKNGETALILAIQAEQVDLVEKILEKQKDSHQIPCTPKDIPEWEIFPIHQAFIQGNKQIVDLLIKFGANLSDVMKNITLNQIERLPQLFEHLLKCGADINVKNNAGRSLAYRAFEDCMHRVNIQNIENGQFLGVSQAESYYLKQLQFLKQYGLKWNSSLVTVAKEAFFGLLAEDSELLHYIHDHAEPS